MPAIRWIWCARCQRCYLRSEIRQGQGSKSGRKAAQGRLCPYIPCPGRVAIDGFLWADARFIAPGVVYPEVPIAGHVYPIPEEQLYQLVDALSV